MSDRINALKAAWHDYAAVNDLNAKRANNTPTARLALGGVMIASVILAPIGLGLVAHTLAKLYKQYKNIRNEQILGDKQLFKGFEATRLSDGSDFSPNVLSRAKQRLKESKKPVEQPDYPTFF